MSAVSDSKEIWSLSQSNEHNKYEKCRNITEEIYKRINITFEIKKLETAGHSEVSDLSDQIDSNELSNETDLFACEKSDSICSSDEQEKPLVKCEKYININNNEELAGKKAVVVYKRPRKRFRKRVKKRPSKVRSDSECSSDEALPLSRMVEGSKCVLTEHCPQSESPDHVMGVPRIVILTKDLKSKVLQSERTSPRVSLPPSKPSKKDQNTSIVQLVCIEKTEVSKTAEPDNETTNRPVKDQEWKDQKTYRPVSCQSEDKGTSEWKHCSLCSLTFRGERGLKRHVKMSHTASNPNGKRNNESNVDG